MFQVVHRLMPRAVARQLGRVFPSYNRRHCPICGESNYEFLPFGIGPRLDAQCPECGSLERHRLTWLFLKRSTDLFQGARKRVLHFAPESMFATRLSKLPHLEYVTADLMGSQVRVRVDITEMPFADSTFDVVFCSHVLEHVPDDLMAMRECHRVLKPGGWAVFLVPVNVPSTIEDPSVTDPADRERLFGQRDHVRRYGPDVVERLQRGGFIVHSYSPDAVAGAERARFAIPSREGPVLFCRRAEA
jgi:hypothetical protein